MGHAALPLSGGHVNVRACLPVAVAAPPRAGRRGAKVVGQSVLALDSQLGLHGCGWIVSGGLQAAGLIANPAYSYRAPEGRRRDACATGMNNAG